MAREAAHSGQVPPQRAQIDAPCREAFTAVNENYVFVLGADSKLWLEQAPFGKVPPSVSTSTPMFARLWPWASTLFFGVGGTDGNLWLEFAPFGTCRRSGSWSLQTCWRFSCSTSMM